MSESMTLYILLGVLIGWLCTLSSGALVGWMIFKTKREPYESLFRLKEPEGAAFNVEEPWDKDFPKPEGIETPPATAAAGLKFRQQMAEEEVPTPKIAEKLGEEKE
jgi:hypothetical protein